MSESDFQQEFGALREAVSTLKISVSQISHDVTAIKAAVSGARGGIAALIATVSVSAACGAIIEAIAHFMSKP